MPQRARFARYPLSVPVSIVTSAGRIEARLVDISGSGLFVRTRLPLRVGEELSVEVRAAAHRLVLRATVIRTVLVDPLDAHPLGVGMEVLSPPPALKALMADLAQGKLAIPDPAVRPGPPRTEPAQVAVPRDPARTTPPPEPARIAMPAPPPRIDDTRDSPTPVDARTLSPRDSPRPPVLASHAPTSHALAAPAGDPPLRARAAPDPSLLVERPFATARAAPAAALAPPATAPSPLARPRPPSPAALFAATVAAGARSGSGPASSAAEAARGPPPMPPSPGNPGSRPAATAPAPPAKAAPSPAPRPPPASAAARPASTAAQAPGGRERRAGQRYPLRLAALVDHKNVGGRATVLDLGAGGAKVEIGPRLAALAKEELLLRFRVSVQPKPGAIELLARVVWHARQDGRIVIGLSFVPVAAEMDALLLELVGMLARDGAAAVMAASVLRT